MLALVLCGYSREVVKRVMRRYGALVLVQKPTRTQALLDGMVDYKHVNPTSCDEKKHSEFVQPVEPNQNTPHEIKSMRMYVSIHPTN